MYKSAKNYLQRSPRKSSMGAVPKKCAVTDQELAELTKREIDFWCRRLHVSPSELEFLSNDELDKRLMDAYQETVDYYVRKEQALRQHRVQRFKKLAKVKRRMLEHQKLIRLRGGAAEPMDEQNQRTALEILHDAARQIEECYGVSCTSPKSRAYANKFSYDDGEYGGGGGEPVNLVYNTRYANATY